MRKTDHFSGIKIGGRNIDNLRYANDTAVITTSEADLQSLKQKVERYSLVSRTKCN